jgi:nucleoid-associated protein YgaU
VLTGVCLALGVALLVLDVLGADEPETAAPPVASVRALVEAPPPVAAPTPAVELAAPVAQAPVLEPAQPVLAPPEPEKPVAVVRTHRVRRGDTLGRIARDYYGSSAQWPKIQKANEQLLGDSVDLGVGMELVIP